MNTYTGTIAFKAPEMFGRDHYNEAVDVWAAGCVLYTMLCGEQPFYSEYIIDLIDLIEKAEIKFPKEIWETISDEAIDLIKRMLEKDPKKRILPKDILNHNWFELQNSQEDNPKTRKTVVSNIQKNLRKITKSRKSFVLP